MDTSTDSLETVIATSPKSVSSGVPTNFQLLNMATGTEARTEDKSTRFPDNAVRMAGQEAGTSLSSANFKDSRRAWIICFSAFAIQVLIVGVLHVFGVFFVAFLEEFHTTKGTAAWVGSGAYGLTMAFGPLTSAVINRFGSRATAMLGSGICALALFISSFVTSIGAMFGTFTFLYGIGTSLAYTPTMCISTEYFDKYYTVATGIMVAGSSTGTLILSPISQALIDSFGWRVSFRVLAVFTMAGVWCGWQFRPVPGAIPLKTVSQKIRLSPARRLMAELHLWKNRVYVIWVMGITMVMFGYYIPYVHLVYHAETIGIPPSRGSILMMTLGGATATGRIMFGKIVQYGYLNRLHMHQVSMVVTGTAVMLLPLIKSFWGLMSYVILVGLVDGCYVVLLPTLTCTLAGAENMVLAWGGLVGVSSITYTLGPPVAGWMFDALGSYDLAFHVAGVPIICGALFLFFIPWAQKTGNSTNVMLAAKSYNVISRVPSDEEQIMVSPNEQDAFRLSQLHYCVHENLPSETCNQPLETPSSNSEDSFIMVNYSDSLPCDQMSSTTRQKGSLHSVNSTNMPEDVRTTISALKKQSAQMVELERLHDDVTGSPCSSAVGSIQSGYLSQPVASSDAVWIEDMAQSPLSDRDSIHLGPLHSHPATSSVAIPAPPRSRSSSRRTSIQEMDFPRSVLSEEDREREIQELMWIFANDSQTSSISPSLGLSPAVSTQGENHSLSRSCRANSPLSVNEWPGQDRTSPGLESPRDSYQFPHIMSNPSLPPLPEQRVAVYQECFDPITIQSTPPPPQISSTPTVEPGTATGCPESSAMIGSSSSGAAVQSPRPSQGSVSGADGDIFHMSDINISTQDD